MEPEEEDLFDEDVKPDLASPSAASARQRRPWGPKWDGTQSVGVEQAAVATAAVRWFVVWLALTVVLTYVFEKVLGRGARKASSPWLTVRSLHKARLAAAVAFTASAVYALTTSVVPSDGSRTTTNALSTLHATCADAWSSRYASPRAQGPPPSALHAYGLDESAAAALSLWLGYLQAELTVAFVLDEGVTAFQNMRDFATLLTLCFTTLTGRAGALAIYTCICRALLRPLEDGARHAHFAFRLSTGAANALQKIAHVAVGIRGSIFVALLVQWMIAYTTGRAGKPAPNTAPKSEASHIPELSLAVLAVSDLVQTAVDMLSLKL